MARHIDSRFKHLKAAVCSGSYSRAHEAVRKLVSRKNSALWLQMIGDAYVDRQGNMWANSQFVQENPDRQQVVDYAFWQIFAVAPEEVCVQAGIQRHQITVIHFRPYFAPAAFESVQPQKIRLKKRYKSNRSRGRMRRMPPDLWRFPRLKEIYANSTAFNELPGSIGKCRSLTILEIRFLNLLGHLWMHSYL